MVKSKDEELSEEPITMVDVVALVLVTRKDNGEQVEIGEEFELPEESLDSLMEKGTVCLSEDYVPPLEEGEEGELEIEVEVEVIEEVEEDDGLPPPTFDAGEDELILFSNESNDEGEE